LGTVKVPGEKKAHSVFLYTLSTCGWCKMTKKLLKDNLVEYEYLDLDKCSLEERKAAVKELKSRGLSLRFPIIIVDGEEVITGYKEEAIKKAVLT
jgi:glutaredoxin